MHILVLIGSLLPAALPSAADAPHLADFSAHLAKAQSLEVHETMQAVNGAPESLSLTLARPNKARIDFGNQIVVADGTTVTTYDKARNVFMKEPQEKATLGSLLTGQDLAIWSAFFGVKSFNPDNATALGKQTLNGQDFEKVQFAVGPNSVIGFLNSDHDLAKAVFTPSAGQTQSNIILNVDTFKIDGSLPANAFDLKAPGDAKEVSAEDFRGLTWYTDLGKAEEAAQKQGKKIFVDFMASWCGPCKMLDREVFTTDKFKKTSSKLIFLRIDVDQQPSVSARYGIEAMPTQMVLDQSGNILGKTVGYGGPEMFFGFLNPFL